MWIEVGAVDWRKHVCMCVCVPVSFFVLGRGQCWFNMICK